MNWYFKTILAQLWEVESSGSFEDELFRIYELEYKLHMLKEKPFSGLPQRKENIIKKVEENFRDALNNIKKRLIRVYREWLDSHAITEPGQWAEKRYEHHQDDIELGLIEIINEYYEYQYGTKLYKDKNHASNDSVFREIINKAFNNIENFTSLQYLKDVLIEDYKEYTLKDLASYDLTGFNEQHGTSFVEAEQAEEYIDNITEEQLNMDLSDILVVEDISSFVSMAQDFMDMNQFLKELYQYIVFPVWYAHWGERGIDDTRKNIEQIFSKLLQKNNNLGEESATINMAINAVHQTGEMLDYIEDESEERGIGETLSELSEGTGVPEWNKDLSTVGVQV